MDGTLRAFLKTPAGQFLARYVVILVVGFAIMALKPVNDKIINPYTSFVAEEGAFALRLFGEDARVHNQILSSSRFAVAIYNGCNGLEAILIFGCGVLAFPTPWPRKLLGLLLGFLGIQLFNVVRIVALYYTGVFRPQWFSTAHVLVWQSLVILFAVSLWVLWVQRYAVKA
ncbi:MAG: exosortase H [Thermoanaerobaculum sp.]|nr:exosortase H [Thermoanaerobaculum sp.]